MSTTISAGTATSGAALSSDTSGILQLQSGSTPTTAVTIGTNQVASFSATSMAVGLSTPNQTGVQIGGTTNPYFRSTSNGGSYTGFDFGQTPAGPGIINMRDNYGINFFTNATQVMTLGTNGNLSITTNAVTSVISARSGVSGDASQEAVQFIKYDNNSTTSQVFAKFFINQGGAISGQINANGANQAAFGSTSDITLKTNITPLDSQLANINAMELIEFDYIESEGGGHNIGFSAQNMQTIYPDTVSTRADGKLTVTGWNKTEARLVKAIQELSAQVTALQTEVTALEAKVGV